MRTIDKVHQNIKEIINMKNWKSVAIITSIVVTVVGIVMMFWDKVVKIYYNLSNR